MKRTFLILLALLTLMSASALSLKENDSINYKPHNGGLAVEVGAGGMFPTGSLGDNLKGGFLFTCGFDFYYNRFAYKLNGSIAAPSFKNENPYAVYDDQGRFTQRNGTGVPGLLGLNIQMGYTVWEQGRVTITPCFGINFNKLMWQMNHIKWTRDDQGEERPEIYDVTNAHESSTGWTASVDIDIVAHQKRYYDNRGFWRTTSLSVRLTPFITHYTYSDFNPSFKGNSIGLTVSCLGFLDKISTR